MNQFKQDMLKETKNRLTHSEKDREIADKLGEDICALCDGVCVSIALNVLTSLLCHIYVSSVRNGDLDTLLANVAHNYRLRMRPDGEEAQ